MIAILNQGNAYVFKLTKFPDVLLKMELAFLKISLIQPEQFLELRKAEKRRRQWNLLELGQWLQQIQEYYQQVWHLHLEFQGQDCQVVRDLIKQSH